MAEPAARPAGQALRLLLSFAYFFFLLAAYYVVRPLREEMGVKFGPERLQWLFTATFITMVALTPVYGAMVSRFRRRIFVPAVYLFFLACLLGFRWIVVRDLGGDWLPPVFYVWVSVFNLFAVSVFWSYMADIWDPSQAKKVFGVIAAGGTCGGVAGPLLTRSMAELIGLPGLMALAAGLLLAALAVVLALGPLATVRKRTGDNATDEAPIGGSMLAGIRLVVSRRELWPLALMMFCGVLVGSIIYLQQARAVEAAIADPIQRTRFFASIDLAVNLITLVAQLGLTRLLFSWLGTGRVLLIPPLLMVLCFSALYFFPVIGVLAVVQTITRAGRFALTEPAMASLYTSLDREVRYKAKAFIDTAVYRFGDLSSAWMVALLSSAGVALAGFALIGIGVATAISRVGFLAGSAHEARVAGIRDKDKQPALVAQPASPPA
ncbi:MAG: MFS transporter [Lysobacterales bacterium]